MSSKFWILINNINNIICKIFIIISIIIIIKNIRSIIL